MKTTITINGMRWPIVADVAGIATRHVVTSPDCGSGFVSSTPLFGQNTKLYEVEVSR